MTKDAFLAALRAHLTGVSPATAGDIVSDYASHFDEGMGPDAANRRSPPPWAIRRGWPANCAPRPG